MQVSELADIAELVYQFFARADPAETQSGGNGFGEGGKIHDISVFVHGFQRGERLALKVQLSVRIILQYRNSIFIYQLQQPDTFGKAHADAGGIMVGRHCIKEFGPVPGQKLFKDFHIHPVIFHGNRHDFGPGGPEALYGGKEGRFLNQDEIARIDKGSGDEIYPLLGNPTAP